MIKVYSHLMMMSKALRLNATELVKQNISALLRLRGLPNKAIAMRCGREESWISKILSDPKRRLPSVYYDRIADLLGVETYQLFQPGIADRAERRSGLDRRQGVERRISPQLRHVRELAARLPTLRPATGANDHGERRAISRRPTTHLDDAHDLPTLIETRNVLDEIIAAAEKPRGSTARARKTVAAPRSHDRATRGPADRKNKPA